MDEMLETAEGKPNHQTGRIFKEDNMKTEICKFKEDFCDDCFLVFGILYCSLSQPTQEYEICGRIADLKECPKETKRKEQEAKWKL